MVRINIIPPQQLSDQHLIAEYDEMLMLAAYIKKYPSLEDASIPQQYTLNTGHMKFFKDKILYLAKRHELLKKEMRSRGFQTNKSINITQFPKENRGDWKSQEKDYKIIKQRITEKLKLKPEYYRYKSEYKPTTFFLDLLRT